MTPAEFQNGIQKIMPQIVYMLKEHDMEHHCIQGAALLTKVLYRTGVSNAHPLTVGVTILNEAFLRYVDEHGAPLDAAARQACNDAGGAQFIVGRDATDIPEGRWPGHLVVIVPGAFGQKHALLDPTITQANWPEVNINLQPICAEVTNDFVSGVVPARLRINGMLLNYEAFPDDHSYNDDEDCMTKDGLDGAVATVLHRLSS